MKKTVAETLAGVKEEHAALLAKLELKLSMLYELPPTLETPIISNEKATGAWLSFRETKAIEVFEALEANGFEWIPATLAKYGDWRASPKYGYAEDLPEKSSNAELRDTEPLVPVWFTCGTLGKSEVHAFYRGPSGRLYAVKIDSDLPIGVNVKRVEFRGGWSYERGSAKLRYPDGWHSLTNAEGTVVASMSASSRAYVDTENWATGVVYFTPFLDHKEWKMSPAEFCKICINGTKSAAFKETK